MAMMGERHRFLSLTTQLLVVPFKFGGSGGRCTVARIQIQPHYPKCRADGPGHPKTNLRPGVFPI